MQALFGEIRTLLLQQDFSELRHHRLQFYFLLEDSLSRKENFPGECFSAITEYHHWVWEEDERAIVLYVDDNEYYITSEYIYISKSVYKEWHARRPFKIR